MRTPADFSREFAGYVAAAAEHYMDAVNAFHSELVESGDMPDTLLLNETYRALRSAIYEWRKREVAAVAEGLTL